MKKFNKSLSFFLCLCMLFSAFSTMVYADNNIETDSEEEITDANSGSCGENLTWCLDDEGTLTISGTGDMDNYGGQWDIYGNIVNAAPWGTDVVKLIVEDGVTSIGNYAFCKCESLVSITIPDSVTKIGVKVFYCCSSLENITLPDSITSIGNYAFSLTAYYNDNSNWGGEYGDTLYIGKYLIEQFSWLSTTSIEYGTELIADSAYFGRGIDSIAIPNTVKYIGEKAFGDCRLSSVKIPNSVISIGAYALGYGYGEKVENFTVYGVKGSAAEIYATENGFIFVEMEEITFPEADSDEYIDLENNTMPNVVAKTSVSTIISKLSEYGIIATVTDKDGNVLADIENVGTGCKVVASDGNVYTAIVKGDIDGTGDVNTTDYLQIKKMFLGDLILENEYFTAADTDGDGSITSTDYLQIKKYFLGNLDLYA